MYIAADGARHAKHAQVVSDDEVRAIRRVHAHLSRADLALSTGLNPALICAIVDHDVRADVVPDESWTFARAIAALITLRDRLAAEDVAAERAS